MLTVDGVGVVTGATELVVVDPGIADDTVGAELVAVGVGAQGVVAVTSRM